MSAAVAVFFGGPLDGETRPVDYPLPVSSSEPAWTNGLADTRFPASTTARYRCVSWTFGNGVPRGRFEYEGVVK